MSNVLNVSINDRIAVLTMTRPGKRNAMNETLFSALEAFFQSPPDGVRVVILTGTEGHFCAGLDLAEHETRTAEENLHHSRRWHRLMDQIQLGGLIVVSAMYGAVMGGGLELASATHVRIAEPTTIFQLPEGRRGIFVGGGATQRVERIIGADRMTEMMLTARKYGHEDGKSLGLAHYTCAEGEALALAEEVAGKIAVNAPMSNYMIVNSIHHAANMASEDALYAESLAAALSQTTEDAAEGLRAFLEKRHPVFR